MGAGQQQVTPEPSAPGGMLDARLTELEERRSTDVSDRLAQARELERMAAASGAGVDWMRARLVVADMLHRLGGVAESAPLAAEVNAWAVAHGHPWLLARSHLVLSSVLEFTGDVSAALDHALWAVQHLDDDVRPRVRGQHLLRLADMLALDGSAQEARRRYAQAEALFAEVGDRPLLLTVLNNLTVMEYELGALGRARAAADHLYATAVGEDFNADFADTIAKVRLLDGDTAGAEAVLQQGYLLLVEQGDSQASTSAELALTHAQVLLATGDLDAAGERLEACRNSCAERGLEWVRIQALATLAELDAARGDFEAAYLTYREHVAALERHRSEQKQAAVRTRNAVFEIDEARREAQRFWEQARTDPLTGLWNRRYVDEEVPRYLTEVGARGSVLVAAILDVDHFKRINDSFSHEVGDQVLIRLATLMTQLCLTEAASAEPGLAGFAARLGGEEFLILQVAASAEHAAAALERLRCDVQRHPWSVLVEGLAVTVSAGAAEAGPADTQHSLLARADGHLYRAKSQGRNRVVTG